MNPEVPRCYLVGAGPGDPGLLTLRGREVLSRAEVVIYDALVNEVILDHCPQTCECIAAGKRAGLPSTPQKNIEELIIDRLKAGKRVVRLKGGDPLTFARGGEEMLAVDAAGFSFEVVPGITAGMASAAYAGIPMTHRDLTASVTFVTAHEQSEAGKVDWRHLAGLGGTLVVYMGTQKMGHWITELLKHGMQADTPAAMIQWGTRSDQRVVFSTLAQLEEASKDLGSPAVVVLGATVSLRERLHWFEERPLFGKRVVVTRSQEQNAEISMLLRGMGAEVLEIPTISISPITPDEGWEKRVRSSQWLAFSSSNGVHSFMSAWLNTYEVRDLAGIRLAAVGPSTAEALRSYYLTVDLIPEKEYSAAGLAQVWPNSKDSAGKVLYVCGNGAGSDFERGLTLAGIRVERLEVYQTRHVVDLQWAPARRFAQEGADWITFCSGSAVNALASAFPELPGKGTRIAALGPQTAGMLKRAGWHCDVIPTESSIPRLVEALCAAELQGRQEAK
ncbi:MAG: uroporphyrinogen-III C-methyltransferase [Candidatus Methylacidiphilales bacterium]